MVLTNLKKILYFSVASYFAFFASIVLRRWKPRIVVITGSSGKSTFLHMMVAQLSSRAKYSFHSNSAFGIPFNILGLERKTLSILEWPAIFIMAPIRAFSQTPTENIYVVEADCDRPNEGEFLAKLLNPEITLWNSLGRTHSMNFEKLVSNNSFKNLEEAIAYEFGYFAEYATGAVFLNSDIPELLSQMNRTSVKVNLFSLKSISLLYRVDTTQTKFIINNKIYLFDYLLPKETAYNILMLESLMKYLGFAFDSRFRTLTLPPGRSSFLKGIKGLSIVDSSYNANLGSMKAILNMYSKIKTTGPKWVVIGDMLEQGENEQKEHLLLAQEINKYMFDKVVLLGPRVQKYTMTKLTGKVSSFLNPKEVLDFIKNESKGGELILFKGARFLEGVIENLLYDKNESVKLARREKVWEVRRHKFGL